MAELSSGACPDIILARSCNTAGERAALLRRRHHGEIVSVGRGAYVDAAAWELMDRRARYLTRVRAVAETLDPATVYSHESAAALWGLPWVGEWPLRVHITTAAAAGGRSNTSVVRHTTGLVERAVSIDGLCVTPIAITVVDLARTADFATAVILADGALRRTAHPLEGVPRTMLTRPDLENELSAIPRNHGSAKARSVVSFADGRADRPGESMSRVSMLRARLMPPQLQVPLHGLSGRTWIVDFWWPEYNLIGEFDGRWKYSNPEFLRGRSPHEVLLDEKLREDDLRAAGLRMSRWSWEIAVSPSRLRTHLLSTGLR